MDGWWRGKGVAYRDLEVRCCAVFCCEFFPLLLPLISSQSLSISCSTSLGQVGFCTVLAHSRTWNVGVLRDDFRLRPGRHGVWTGEGGIGWMRNA